MRKLIVMILAVVSILLLGLVSRDVFRQELIQLADGRILAVEKCWFLGEKVFCEGDGGFHVLARREICGQTQGWPADMTQLRIRLTYLTGGWLQWEMDASQRLAFVQGIFAVVLVLAAIWAVGRLTRLQRRWRRPADPKNDGGASDGGRNRSPSGGVCPRLAGLADVEAHFLEIFRHQLGADPQTPSRVELIQADPGGRGGLYALAVYHDGRWRERRMSITPLGEGTSSKSQCFYVIYDTHLVVKIPPLAISDFSDYRQRLSQEAHVAAQLGQRPYIIPNLGALLSRVHRLDTPDEKPERREAAYLRWLEKDPARQRFLKIGGAFAFFMDVSRYRFLGQVLAQLRDIQGRWAETIEEDLDLVDYPPRFEEKYGPASGPLGFQIQSLLAVFDHQWRRQSAGSREPAVVTERQKKEWLLTRLAGMPPQVGPAPDDGPAAAADRILRGMLAQHSAVAGAYRRLVEGEARQRTFRQAGPRMAALVTHVLDLLAWLGHRRVAIRDLKPDNLFVAGDPGQYPHFLSDPERFTIGLIDVETAVVCPPSGAAPCGQPQLGGTPPYATPSHFFPNHVLLQALGGDPARILHFQDWHAVVGIVFEIIAGRRLFARSAKRIPGLINALRQNGCRGTAAQSLFRTFSHHFWSVARAEFDRRMVKAAPRLAAIVVEVPDPLCQELVAHLEAGQKDLEAQIEGMTDQWDAGLGEVRQEIRRNGGLEALRRIMAGCQDQDTPEAQGHLSRCFALVPLVQSREEGRRLMGDLSRRPARMPVSALLPLMFARVEAVMRALPADTGSDGRPMPAQAWRGNALDAETLGYTHSLGVSLTLARQSSDRS